ncbi:ATP-dependent protease ATPase subunit HslU [bacterium]|nr:ATP-dependent protease ATPase subunit HslU [bacterium]
MADELTPRQIVAELDKYIIGQHKAKRAVAIALRNRARRREIPEELRDEVIPKNILMIGPTGVGKTEIARRLANLAHAPFIKVEATKFTEVGYVGRDVDSMIRDLVDTAYRLVEEEYFDDVWEDAEKSAEARLLDYLAGKGAPAPTTRPAPLVSAVEALDGPTQDELAEARRRSEDIQHQEERVRDFTRKRLAAGELEEEEIEIEVEESAMQTMQVFSGAGLEEMGFNMQDLLGNLFPGKKTRKRMTVAEARRVLTYQEAEKLVDQQEVTREALERVEENAIIFLDELDKIAGRESGQGPDVSREGVQRDILPIVEGSTVMTKYGPVDTSHILFIAAGAFHVAKPSDLIPELQGRFPIRVELTSLTQEDFRKILEEPQNSLVKQYTALLATEGVELEFSDDALDEIARLARAVNDTTENIGARRLYTMMERLLDELSFEAPEVGEQKVVVDAAYVLTQLKEVVEKQDLARYML